MTELTTNQLVKIILGIVVVVAVIVGLVLVFKNKIITFFQNLPGSAPEIFLSLVK